MAPSIRVDDEVYEALKQRAEPFRDTPNSVLRRVLALDADEQEVTQPKRTPSGRLAPGSLVHGREYRLPILQALAQRGGSAPARDVIAAVGEALEDQFTDLDYSRNKTGGVRWINRTMWVRAGLVRHGFLKSDSPTGTWELSEKGWEYARAGRLPEWPR